MGNAQTQDRTAGGTVGKALEILELVASFNRPVRFGELLPVSRFPKATAYRLLQTLADQGMLDYNSQDQTYTPGIHLVRLAHSAWMHFSLARVARPHLDELSKLAGETIHLAQLDHGQVLYLDKRHATRPVEMFSEAGKIGPAYCTGIGKAMLAHLNASDLETVLSQQSFHRYTSSTLTDSKSLLEELDVIKERGFALDREEHEPGIICIAAPILSAQQTVLGGVSITGATGRTSFDHLETLLPDLLTTAKRISETAAAWRFPETPTAQDQART